MTNVNKYMKRPLNTDLLAFYSVNENPVSSRTFIGDLVATSSTKAQTPTRVLDGFALHLRGKFSTTGGCIL
jgi:hypothetical protein